MSSSQVGQDPCLAAVSGRAGHSALTVSTRECSEDIQRSDTISERFGSVPAAIDAPTINDAEIGSLGRLSAIVCDTVRMGRRRRP